MTARLSGGKTIARLSLSQYRRLTTLLNSIRSLEKHVQIADSLGLPYSTGTLREELSSLLTSFRKPTVLSLLSSNNSTKREKIDTYGRAYAVGRRKESSAQVWLVPSKEEIGQILINGESLSNYFASPTIREDVLRPFTLTGTLGKYNAFVLARGGGVSGQAGAARLGIAKALLAFEEGEEVKKSLRSGGSAPVLRHRKLICVGRGYAQSGSENGGKEEDWSAQSEKEAECVAAVWFTTCE